MQKNQDASSDPRLPEGQAQWNSTGPSHAPPFPTERWARWNQDILVLRGHVTNLYERQRVWKAYVAASGEIRMTEAAFVMHEWMVRNYSDAMTIGIRRLIDRRTARNTPVSLHELVTNISDHVADVTLENYLSLWNPGNALHQARATRAFNTLFPEAGRPTRESLVEEADRLRTSAEAILTHADKRVAHIGRGDLPALPRWRDLDEALELLATVFRRYYALLTGNEYRLDLMGMPPGWEIAIERACQASVRERGG